MEPAPFFADLAEGPAGGHAVWLRAEDGVRLRMGVWPAGPRGAVMLFPGRTEVAEKYGRVAASLAGHGLGLFVIDWRGQGLSDRELPLLGHVSDFAMFQRDAAAYAEGVHAVLGAPAGLVLAHSMGGCIALRALIGGLPARAVAFSAPLWGLPMGGVMAGGLRILRGASRLGGFDRRPVPGAGIEFHLWENPFDDNELTGDRETYAWMQHQVQARPELRQGAPTIGWLTATLAETRELKALPAPGIPCFTGLGTREKVIAPEAIEARMARWPDGRLEIIEGAEHELMMERPEMRRRFLSGALEVFGV